MLADGVVWRGEEGEATEDFSGCFFQEAVEIGEQSEMLFQIGGEPARGGIWIMQTDQHIILLNSPHYAKSSLTRVFSRSFSVPCAPFSPLTVLVDHQVLNGALGTKSFC